MGPYFRRFTPGGLGRSFWSHHLHFLISFSSSYPVHYAQHLHLCFTSISVSQYILNHPYFFGMVALVSGCWTFLTACKAAFWFRARWNCHYLRVLLSVIPSPSLLPSLRLCKVGQATTTDMECTRQKIDLKPLETKWRGRRHEICLFCMACCTRWGHFRNFFDIYKPLMF